MITNSQDIRDYYINFTQTPLPRRVEITDVSENYRKLDIPYDMVISFCQSSMVYNTEGRKFIRVWEDDKKYIVGTDELDMYCAKRYDGRYLLFLKVGSKVQGLQNDSLTYYLPVTRRQGK